ncbi:MAG: hypothetical protein ABIA74_01165 [bacterium]
MKFIKSIILFLLISNILFSTSIHAASIDGTTNIAYINYHYPFANTNTAQGFVRLVNGFTIPASATVTFNIHPPVSGGIQLNDTGTIKLDSNLYLDSSVTLSTGGHINGQEKTIYLDGNLIIPAGKNLKITGDTIIDGSNFDLILGHQSQLIVDNNITLTLKNINLKNTHNDQAFPQIKLNNVFSQLALENVIFSFNDDFIFDKGTLFINNDVIITGTSKFIYKSTNPTYIQSHSTIYFDKNTTFDYSPNSDTNNLIILTDQSSSIYLDGCTLQVTDTGIKLTKGQLFFDNKVTLSNSDSYVLSDITRVDTKNNGGYLFATGWHPTNNYLVTGGYGSNTPEGGELQLYSFQNDTLTSVTYRDYDINSNIRSLDWSPDGNYLAIGGSFHDGTFGGIFVYSFFNNTLSDAAIALADLGENSLCIKWHPNGNFIAFGISVPFSGLELQIYSFQNDTLTSYTSANYGSTTGSTELFSVAWSPDGNYLAIGGDYPDSGNELQIYSFQNDVLATYTSKNYGYGVFTLDWSPDGNYLAVGGTSPDSGDELQIYSFFGGELSSTPVDSKNYGTRIWSTKWSSDGRYLAIGGYNPAGGNELQIYSFTGGTLSSIPIISKNFNNEIYSLDWKQPNNNFLAAAGNYSSSHVEELQVYRSDYLYSTYSPTFYNSIIFGDSSLGSEYNLNTYLLSGAQVELTGPVWIDDAD